jgi:hypothetical protein
MKKYFLSLFFFGGYMYGSNSNLQQNPEFIDKINIQIEPDQQNKYLDKMKLTKDLFIEKNGKYHKKIFKDISKGEDVFLNFTKNINNSFNEYIEKSEYFISNQNLKKGDVVQQKHENDILLLKSPLQLKNEDEPLLRVSDISHMRPSQMRPSQIPQMAPSIISEQFNANNIEEFFINYKKEISVLSELSDTQKNMLSIHFDKIFELYTNTKNKILSKNKTFMNTWSKLFEEILKYKKSIDYIIYKKIQKLEKDKEILKINSLKLDSQHKKIITEYFVSISSEDLPIENFFPYFKYKMGVEDFYNNFKQLRTKKFYEEDIVKKVNFIQKCYTLLNDEVKKKFFETKSKDNIIIMIDKIKNNINFLKKERIDDVQYSIITNMLKNSKELSSKIKEYNDSVVIRKTCWTITKGSLVYLIPTFVSVLVVLDIFAPEIFH